MTEPAATIFRSYIFHLTFYIYMCHVGTDIHEVGNAVTALTFGIALEEFANLEEQHDEDGLRIFCLGTRQETDAQGSDGSYRHEEMFVEHVALRDAFPCFVQCLVTYQQIRYKINQQQKLTVDKVEEQCRVR